MTKLNKTIASSLTCVFLILAGASASAQSGDIGLGVIIGNPTGISAKFYMDSTTAIDAALGWSLGGHRHIHLHSTYLWHKPKIFSIKDQHHFTLFYGVGGRFRSWEHEHDHSRHPHSAGHHHHDREDDWSLGVRAPVGLSFIFPDPRFEVFGEVALALDVVPQTDVDLDLGIGGRFYF